jgi:hypothetical protein
LRFGFGFGLLVLDLVVEVSDLVFDFPDLVSDSVPTWFFDFIVSTEVWVLGFRFWF